MDYSGRRSGGTERVRLDTLDFKEISADVVNAIEANVEGTLTADLIEVQRIRAFLCFCDAVRATSLAVGDPDAPNALYTFPFNAPLPSQILSTNAVGGLVWSTAPESPTKALFTQTVTKTNIGSDLEALCTTTGPGSRFVPANTIQAGDIYEFTCSGVLTLFGATSITFRIRAGPAAAPPATRPLVTEDTFALSPLIDNVPFTYTGRFCVRSIGAVPTILGSAALSVDGFPNRVGDSFLPPALTTMDDQFFDLTTEFDLPEVGSSVSVRLLEFRRSRV